MAEYRRSRLTQRRFAARIGIGYSTLTLWLRQASPGKKSGRFTLVPVPNMFSAAAGVPAYRVQFPGGVMVEVSAGFESEELGVLLNQVRGL